MAKQRKGLVFRILNAGFGYIEDSETHETFVFYLKDIVGPKGGIYKGDKCEELTNFSPKGLVMGTEVAFWTGQNHKIEKVAPITV